MKVYFYALMAMSLITTQINADESSDLNSSDADEIVVTSSILNPSRILNPLYVIDGDEIEDNATTSLGEAVDSYLGVSIADYGAAVGQPIIRGMSGPRVKILKNGMVNRDVSGLGADHLNDIDLNDLQQVEIVKGPSSLLYANGTSGGIINVVDNCIAPEDFTTQEFIAGLETQSVNDGDSQYFNFKDNLNGFNVNVGYKKSEFGNFDIPDDAVMHDEDHEGHDEHEGEEELSYLENSDLEIESTKFGISRAGEWGYVGISVDNHESMYGIPYHGEHSDEEGHDDHDDDHGDDDHDDDHGDEHGDDDHDDHGEFENLIHADYVQEDAEFRGYEFEFGRTFTLGSGDLRLSFGRDDVNAEFSDGHNVPRINPARNIYSLSYVENDWVFKIDLKDVEKQNDIAEGETMTDSYQMLNTRLTKTFNISGAGELKVSIFGSNLLDEAARNHSSFVKKQVPLAGRNYGAKFSYKF